jgi:glycosyltransferase involved in cell wall biosynthesis
MRGRCGSLGCGQIWHGKEIVVVDDGSTEGLWQSRGNLSRKREKNLHMQTAIRLVSRELTEAARLWDLRLLEDDDGEYFFRVINASNGIRFVPQSWVYYRIFRRAT